MKKVTLTNATVVPFYRANDSDPIEIVRVMEKKPEYNSQMVIFNIETKVDDNPSKKGKIFERCTVYAKNDEKVRSLQKTLTNGLLVDIEGRETRIPGKKDGKFYSNIVVEKIVPISGEVEEDPPIDDDLPF